MRYKADTLDDIYAILEKMKKPVALFDFLSGEMGYEALCAQAICGHFYDTYNSAMPVVALTWRGCSLVYENVSHHQIEFRDIESSMRGNIHHRGEPRWAWLVLQEHGAQLANIASIAERVGPSYWAGGHVDDVRLAGFIPQHYLWKAQQLKTNRAGIIESTERRLTETGYVFQPPTKRLIEDAYIAVFDRNEVSRRSQGRNTQEWQIEYLYELAQKFPVKLVVLAGLHPREGLPGDVIHLKPQHRDLDLICNVVRHSLFFAAPPCGAAEVACVFGCDFLALGNLGIGYGNLMLMIINRQFARLGQLIGDDDEYIHTRRAREEIQRHLEAKCLV